MKMMRYKKFISVVNNRVEEKEPGITHFYPKKKGLTLSADLHIQEDSEEAKLIFRFRPMGKQKFPDISKLTWENHYTL